MKTIYWVHYTNGNGKQYLKFENTKDMYDHCKSNNLFNENDCFKAWTFIEETNKGKIETKRYENVTMLKLTYY